MYFFDFCENFKNTLFIETLEVTTFGSSGRSLPKDIPDIILKTLKWHLLMQ